MADLSLPFWILIDPQAELAPCVFSTTAKLSDFLDAELFAHWRMSLIGDREALVLAIADAHQQAATLIWLDPLAGAEPGDAIQLINLVELNERLKQVA